mmetsp:Transcript_5433/g.7863  ORF Transcript_5433/g.7863 Transcript_5433/m.7863 type:complete len:315 (+) Transcript_5433:50-994(+)|eukprot:CAMPEP_0194219568 /NCGR_PEP_ID=MMETSP0156-20130528/26281_1 /TAXON_ID=33649 /ORGANISM="Thalassionema nitzschioides, Strain L26-B" /LENGTH=314 /DNA_ID=CAMNT_0038949289 /DNA_START=27 /DNA_END=971 /DNA_ORIENTATION=-
MNSLYPSKNEWIADHDDGGSLSVDSNSGSITFSSTTKGTPFNIRLNNPSAAAPSSMFYEIDIVEIDGSLGVGVVSENEFQPGWKTKGMFYNGNLTNGSAGLTIGFGDKPKKGDKIGVYLIGNDTSMEIVFYVNGTCLGTGFRLDKAPNDVFYPCLHLSGSAVVHFSAPKEFPDTINRESPKNSDKYIGDWALKQAFAGPELGEFPLPAGKQCILSFSSDGSSTYQLNIKLGNSIFTTVAITGKMENFDKIEIEEVSSTKMMPPPDIYKVECFLAESLPKMFKMIVSDRDLIMTGATAEFICSPHEKKFDPLKSY